MVINITNDEFRNHLGTDEEVDLCKDLLKDEVLDITEAIECYGECEIVQWLADNAEKYGYKKVDD